MLNTALKYNWWTPDNKKEKISLEARIEYILKYGTLSELKMMIREIGKAKITEIWRKCFEYKKPRGRAHLIEYLLQ